MRSLIRLCRVASPRRVRIESSKIDARRAFVSTSTTRGDASASDDDDDESASTFDPILDSCRPRNVPSRGLILYPWINV